MALSNTFSAGREQCFQQIEKLTNSHSLKTSESLCKLLRYLAEHSLDRPGIALKEYQIATEILGRPPGFDPQSDSTVRVQAGRLRMKLSDYYLHEGPDDPILVELPKGSYALSFHARTPSVVSGHAAPALVQRSGRRTDRTPVRGWTIAVIILSLLLAASLMTSAILASRLRRQLAPAESIPAVYQIFWNRFVATPQRPWVVFSNGSFVGRPETGMRYFNPA